MGKAIKKVGKAVSKTVSGVGHEVKDVYNSDLGRALTYAAVAVAAVYTGGAALGAMGVGGLGATAAAAGGGLTGAMAAGASAVGTAGLVAGAVGALSGHQSYQAQVQQEKAEAAEARATAQAEAADRESEILRKQALLASQKSMTARKAAAGTVSNKLKNTSQSVLGDEEEKLGG